MSKSEKIQFRITESQFTEWSNIAADDHRDLNDWARRVLKAVSQYQMGVKDLSELLRLFSESGMSISELERLTAKQRKKHD